jgi:hypothetical protein
VGTHVQDGLPEVPVHIALNDKTNRLLTAKISNHFGFSRSVTSNQAYPSSLMGMMALLRQVNHDLKWYKNGILKIRIISRLVRK